MISKEEVIIILNKVDRPGWKNLLVYLEQKGFYEAPSSAEHHGAVEGGLMNHCNSVYELFSKLNKEFNLEISEDSLIVTSFLHDLCKVGAYIKNGKKYVWNKEHQKGHAKLSIEMVNKYIVLTEDEEQMIKFHMGMYGTTEFGRGGGEYHLWDLVRVYNSNKNCKLFYFCDDMSAQFVEV